MSNRTGTIKQKLLFWILLITLITYGGTLGFFSWQLRQNGLQEGKKLAESAVREKAENIKARLQEDVVTARTMGSMITNFLDYDQETREELEKNLLTSVYRNNPEYRAIYLSLELSEIDPSWDKPHGRKDHLLSNAG